VAVRPGDDRAPSLQLLGKRVVRPWKGRGGEVGGEVGGERGGGEVG
jgi:hypothetical protein